MRSIYFPYEGILLEKFGVISDLYYTRFMELLESTGEKFDIYIGTSKKYSKRSYYYPSLKVYQEFKGDCDYKIDFENFRLYTGNTPQSLNRIPDDIINMDMFLLACLLAIKKDIFKFGIEEVAQGVYFGKVVPVTRYRMKEHLLTESSDVIKSVSLSDPKKINNNYDEMKKVFETV